MRPGDSVNVTRIEHENLESAVRENRLALERLERKVDDLAHEMALVKKMVRSLTTLS